VQIGKRDSRGQDLDRGLSGEKAWKCEEIHLQLIADADFLDTLPFQVRCSNAITIWVYFPSRAQNGTIVTTVKVGRYEKGSLDTKDASPMQGHLYYMSAIEPWGLL